VDVSHVDEEDVESGDDIAPLPVVQSTNHTKLPIEAMLVSTNGVAPPPHLTSPANNTASDTPARRPSLVESWGTALLTAFRGNGVAKSGLEEASVTGGGGGSVVGGSMIGGGGSVLGDGGSVMGDEGSVRGRGPKGDGGSISGDSVAGGSVTGGRGPGRSVSGSIRGGSTLRGSPPLTRGTSPALSVPNVRPTSESQSTAPQPGRRTPRILRTPITGVGVSWNDDRSVSSNGAARVVHLQESQLPNGHGANGYGDQPNGSPDGRAWGWMADGEVPEETDEAYAFC